MLSDGILLEIMGGYNTEITVVGDEGADFHGAIVAAAAF